MDKSFKNQFANGLKDDITRPLTKNLLSTKPELNFIQFRAEVASLSGSRLKRPSTKVQTNVIEDEEDDPKPQKRVKKGESSIDVQLRSIREENKKLHKKIDQFTTLQSNFNPELTSTVLSSNQAGHSKKQEVIHQVNRKEILI